MKRIEEKRKMEVVIELVVMVVVVVALYGVRRSGRLDPTPSQG